MSLLHVTVVVGTRPEVLKMAPVLHAMRARGVFDIDLCAVAQHGALLDQALRDTALVPTARLPLGEGALPLGDSLAAAVSAVAARLKVRPARAVVVQGDTTSTLGGALAGFYAGVPVAHVEAGLRSGDPAAPFPEEMHRALVDRLSSALYAPSAQARENLLREGFNPSRVVQVGNTTIDALRGLSAARPGAARRTTRVLVTCHRRENFGDGVRGVCEAVRALVARHPSVEVDYVLHPHPGAHEASEAQLRDVPRVRLHPPLPHADFLALLHRASVVLTDSGGVQEEAACSVARCSFCGAAPSASRPFAAASRGWSARSPRRWSRRCSTRCATGTRTWRPSSTTATATPAGASPRTSSGA